MTQIILKNQINQSDLDALLVFLNTRGLDAEIAATTTIKKKTLTGDPFAEIRGMWSDYDINAKELRRKAWGTDKLLEK